MSQHVTFDCMPRVFEYDTYRQSRKTLKIRRRPTNEEEDDDEKLSVSSEIESSRSIPRSLQVESTTVDQCEGLFKEHRHTLPSDNVGEMGFKRNALTIDEVEVGGIVVAVRSAKARLEEQKEQLVVQLNDQWEQERQRILKKWKNQEELLRSKHQRSFSRNTTTAGLA